MKKLFSSYDLVQMNLVRELNHKATVLIYDSVENNLFAEFSFQDRDPFVIGLISEDFDFNDMASAKQYVADHLVEFVQWLNMVESSYILNVEDKIYENQTGSRCIDTQCNKCPCFVHGTCLLSAVAANDSGY